MSHIRDMWLIYRRKFGGAHMVESCHTYEWVMSHVWLRHVMHMSWWVKWGLKGPIWMSDVTHMDKLHICLGGSRGVRCSYGWVMSNKWMKHATHMTMLVKGSLMGQEEFQSTSKPFLGGLIRAPSISTSHATRENESCHTFINQSTRINESCHTYKWVTANTERRELHVWVSHVTLLPRSAWNFVKCMYTGCVLKCVLQCVVQCVLQCAL